MEINGKRIFVVIISVILLLGFVALKFTFSEIIVKGEEKISYVKETDTEFDLENDAVIRNKPEFSSKVIGTIKKGTHVPVLHKLNKWIKITDGTNEGWSVMQNVVTVEIENESTTNETTPTVDSNTIENTNNMTNDVTNKIENSANTTNSVTNKVENDTNTTNSVENTSNTTVSSNTTTSKPISNTGKVGVVNVETAKVREKPEGKMVGLVDLNDKVEILAEEGEWYKVNIDEYKNCYIAKRLVTIK